MVQYGSMDGESKLLPWTLKSDEMTGVGSLAAFTFRCTAVHVHTVNMAARLPAPRGCLDSQRISMSIAEYHEV